MSTEPILGIRFFKGTAADACDAFLSSHGLLVIPASPPLTKLQTDDAYRHALKEADIVLLDSGLVAAAWRALGGGRVTRISGLHYLRSLLDRLKLEGKENTILWLLAPERAENSAAWLRSHQLAGVGDEQIRVIAPHQPSAEHALLMEIEERRPAHIIIATGSGTQETLGLYLRDYLLYRPCIHCVGAALAFLTGVERAIPAWAEKARLGWFFRLISQPHMILPRLGIAFSLLLMLIRHRSALPPLRPRWADV